MKQTTLPFKFPDEVQLSFMDFPKHYMAKMLPKNPWDFDHLTHTLKICTPKFWKPQSTFALPTSKIYANVVDKSLPD